MIPVIEFSGYLAIVIPILFIVFRLYYCAHIYKKRMIMEILSVALLTSLIWLTYGLYRKFKPLICQFMVITLFYFVTISYMYYMNYHKDV